MCNPANKHGPPRRVAAHRHKPARRRRAYASDGNILTKHHEGSNPLTMSYDAANRLVTTLQGSNIGTYTFDANGNTTQERMDAIGVLATWVYDGENRPINETRSSSFRHTYTYGSDGLRRSAYHAGTAGVVTFVWDGADLLNEMIEGSVAARYAVLDGEVLSEKRGAYRYRLVPDPLGSVNHLLDTTPAIAATYTYWSYGEVQSHTGADSPLQFVGGLGYYTAVANRVYVRARYYRPDLGRWVTEDPIGLVGGDRNLYRYVRGAPHAWVDRFGLQTGVYHPCMADPCTYAFAHGVLVPRDTWGDTRAGTVGCVVCCDGKAVPCIVYPGPGLHPFERLIHDCTLGHEQTHADSTTKCACKDWFECVGGTLMDECVAYGKELDCLLNGLANACLLGPDPTCQAQVLFWACQACMNYPAGCGAKPALCGPTVGPCAQLGIALAGHRVPR